MFYDLSYELQALKLVRRLYISRSLK